MHPERFRRIKEHYMAAIDLDAAGRSAYLLALPDGDQELREDILELLRESDSTTGIDLAPDAEAPRSTAGEGGRAVDWAPESIGPYRIVRPIGRGGMGAVFEAEQLSPKRKVALKILRTGLGDARFRERFRREAEILGRMEHEGIARIFEAGVWPSPFGDEPYIAMEYVEGEDLERYVRSRRLTPRTILELIRKTALGLAHAHRRGIVHRDLKPQNILVTGDGLPKILDFGISRFADVTKETGRGMTETGQILGTLLYMSPEQARGEEVDWRADVYALGAITYELLTERRPGELPRATIAETLRVILEVAPEPLDRVQPAIDPDVAVIVHHALEKDPGRRYEDAQAMADDIGRYLGHLPIQARPPSAAYLLRKFATRHRALCGGIAATFLALTGGIVSTMRQVRRTESAKADLQIAKDIADRRADEAFRAKVAAEESRAAAEDRLDEANAVRGVLEDMIQAARANAKGRDVKVIDALALAERYATERFVGRPNVEAAVRASIGRAYSQLGNYAAARRELSAAIDLLEKTASPGDVLLIDARIGLAECEIYSGRFDEADDLLSDAVDSAKVGGPASAPRLAQALAALAKVRRNRGKLASAAATYAKAIEAVAAAFGGDSENVAIATNDYGLLLQDLGRYADAEAAFRKSLALFTGKGAGRTANAAVTRANLGLALTYLDRAAESLPLFEEALEIGEKTFGPDHDMLARFKANQALALSKLHRLDEAKRAALDAIEVLDRSPENSAFVRAAALSRLGTVRSESGELEEAEKNLREAVALASDALGAAHIIALDARLQLAGVLTRAQRIDEAARELAVLVDLAKKGLDPDRPETAQYLIEQGGVLRASGRRDEALAAFIEGAERFSKRFGDAHPATRNAIGRVIEELTALGRDAEAAAYRKRL